MVVVVRRSSQSFVSWIAFVGKRCVVVSVAPPSDMPENEADAAHTHDHVFIWCGSNYTACCGGAATARTVINKAGNVVKSSRGREREAGPSPPLSQVQARAKPARGHEDGMYTGATLTQALFGRSNGLTEAPEGRPARHEVRERVLLARHGDRFSPGVRWKGSNFVCDVSLRRL